MRLEDYERKRTHHVGVHSGQLLLSYYFNYKKSGRPKSVMVYNNGEWLDYPKDVVDLIKNAFKIKKAAEEIRLDGHDLMLDFLHMCQVDMKTGLQQPIAWIDEVGGCFFPETCVASDNSKLTKCNGDFNGGETVVQNHVGLVPYTRYVQGKLDSDYVQEMFLSGMNSFDSTDFEIVETYRCSGASIQAQLELFQTQAAITKEFHGDTNVRYGWLPFSKGELSTMMECGLGHYTLRETKCTYAIGVHLAVVTCPYASARYCGADENGVRHLMLCRVIMGNMEVLHPGIGTNNGQFQPSKSEYDNGVDDIQCPRYYIVWNMNVNTHIYPEFIVSFKVFGNAEGYFCRTVGENNDYGANSSQANSVSHGSSDLILSASSVNNGIVTNSVARTPKIPKSPWLPLPMLIDAISDKVSANDMSLIRAHYELYKAKQISRHDFVKEMRLIVGDTVLRATITNFQFKIPSIVELEGPNQNEG